MLLKRFFYLYIVLNCFNFLSAFSNPILPPCDVLTGVNLGVINGPVRINPTATSASFSIASSTLSLENIIWFLPSGVILTSNNNGLSISVSISSTFTNGCIKVKAKNSCNGTESLISTICIVRDEVENIQINGLQYVGCPPQRTNPFQYSISPISGATRYEWVFDPLIRNPSATLNNSNSTTVDISFNPNFKYVRLLVSAYDVNGVLLAQGKISIYTLEINTNDIISGPTAICQAGTYTYSIPTVPGAQSYEWILPPGFSLVGISNTNSINTTTLGSVSGTIQVRALSACGYSQWLTLLISSAPYPSYIYGEREICSSTSNQINTGNNVVVTEYLDEYEYSVNNIPGFTFQWTLPNGVEFVAGTPTNTNTVMIKFGDNFTGGNLCVESISSSCGSSARRCINIGFVNLDIKVEPETDNFCNVSEAIFEIPEGVFAPYIWEIPSGFTPIPIEPGYNSELGQVGVGGAIQSGTPKIKVEWVNPLSIPNNNVIKLKFFNSCGIGQTIKKNIECPWRTNLQNCNNNAPVEVEYNQNIHAIQVLGATNYKYKFYTNSNSNSLFEYTTNASFFSFETLENQGGWIFEFPKTYIVKIQVQINDEVNNGEIVWKDEGYPCEITVKSPIQTIDSVHLGDCPSTSDDKIYSTSLRDGMDYVFDIYDINDNFITSIQKPEGINFIRFSEHPTVFIFGNKYKIGVRVKRDANNDGLEQFPPIPTNNTYFSNLQTIRYFYGTSNVPDIMTSCLGDTITLAVVNYNLQFPNSNVEYKWYKAGALVPNETAFSLSVQTTDLGTFTYKCEIKVFGIICEKTFRLTVLPKVIPNFIENGPICKGDSLPALPTTSINGITGTWLPTSMNNMTTTTYTFTPEYDVTSSQCNQTTTMTITVNPLPDEPFVDNIQKFCKNDNPKLDDIEITPTNCSNCIIKWYDAAIDGIELNSATTFLNDGETYYITQTNGNGCESNRKEINVTLINPTLPQIETNLSFCKEDMPTTSSIDTGQVVMNWYDFRGNLIPSNYIFQNGDIIYGEAIEVVGGEPCESINRLQVNITIINSKLQYYNLITTDENNYNNSLFFENIDNFPKNSLEIFNRYGTLVWKTIDYDNLNNKFIGKANVSGVLSNEDFLPSGTYFFVLKLETECDNEIKGFIHLENK